MEDMDVATFVLGPDTTEEELIRKMDEFRPLLDSGKQVAISAN